MVKVCGPLEILPWDYGERHAHAVFTIMCETEIRRASRDNERTNCIPCTVGAACADASRCVQCGGSARTTTPRPAPRAKGPSHADRTLVCGAPPQRRCGSDKPVRADLACLFLPTAGSTPSWFSTKSGCPAPCRLRQQVGRPSWLRCADHSQSTTAHRERQKAPGTVRRRTLSVTCQ